ncbi:hypothetical protein WEI85_27610 [Actinomycetes bacterium KLBMP 9797]
MVLVAPEVAAAVLTAMRDGPEALEARAIGTVTADPAGRVTARTLVGSTCIVDMLVGEQLPASANP